ncbi:MAG: LPXTG cell wall anchor domain-containing protein [Actinobacteria bacterium]|nr:LPXTG cell wall anchor domain-containing protein [Actinomycetota bacterium]
MHEAEDGGDGTDSTRRRAPRALRLLAAISLVVGVGVASVAVPSAAVRPAAAEETSSNDAAYVLSDVHCSRGGDGVLDLTLVNESSLVGAEFIVDGHDAASSAAVLVAPASVHALAYTGLADGEVEVPVRIDGEALLVREVVDCDPPRLGSRLSSTAVAGSAPVDTPELPRTGGDSGGFVIGGLLVSAGIAASLLARRRYG